jgi:hypothetical protein
LIKSAPFDSGTAIAHLDPNVALASRHGNAHWRFGCSVVDRVGDQIPQQLLNPPPIAGTVAVPRDLELQTACRVGARSNSTCSAQIATEIHLRGDDVDTQTEIRAVEIDEVISKAAGEHRCGSGVPRQPKHRRRIELSKV